MSLHEQLEDLSARLAVGLRNLPGATDLYLFGSRMGSQGDQYADIDLQVITADMEASRLVWPSFLERVGPMELVWPIEAGPDNTAFAILFQGASCYHKMDIGLSATSERARFAAAYVALWSQRPPAAPLAAPTSRAYMPSHGSVGHTLFDDLIASVRYIKARKRDQHLTCWRFLRSKPDRLLHLLYEQRHGWRSRQSLTTWDYKLLDEVLDQDTSAEIVKHLDWSTPSAADRNFWWFTEQTTNLYLAKAPVCRELIPAAIVERHLTFIRAELAL